MLRREVEGNTIKSRGESHSRGWWWWWWTPPRRVGRGQGVEAAGSQGPQHAGLTPIPGVRENVEPPPYSPAWAGASASLLPGTTWVFSPPTHPGWRGAGRRRGGPPASAPDLLSQHPEEGRARGSHPPAPQELRSVAAPDQSLRRPSPWQLQHQARPPRGALAAKSSTWRRVSARVRGRCGRARHS